MNILSVKYILYVLIINTPLDTKDRKIIAIIRFPGNFVSMGAICMNAIDIKMNNAALMRSQAILVSMSFITVMPNKSSPSRKLRVGYVIMKMTLYIKKRM